MVLNENARALTLDSPFWSKLGQWVHNFLAFKQTIKFKNKEFSCGYSSDKNAKLINWKKNIFNEDLFFCWDLEPIV